MNGLLTVHGNIQSHQNLSIVYHSYIQLNRNLRSRLTLVMSRKSCQLIFKQLLPPVHRACRLVPELTLSILTSSNPLWHIPYGEAMKQLDRDDPWWAFLWPGSQALCR